MLPMCHASPDIPFEGRSSLLSAQNTSEGYLRHLRGMSLDFLCNEKDFGASVVEKNNSEQ